ncbi:MAG: right-handed parallel beta-helix repeat-containing protein [Victivallaceae bacterium]|nr:right-handed parallel beta-helix repeat-containing protein [Victivallaceae bacterium]
MGLDDKKLYEDVLYEGLEGHDAAALGEAVANNGYTYTTPQTVSSGSASYVKDVFGNITDDSALSVYGGATATIDASTFSGNTAFDGGAIYNTAGTVNVTGSTFTGNSAPDSGGAIYNISGTAYVTGSEFSGNTAGTGGAIYNTGTATIENSVFSDNAAVRGFAKGGAVYNTGTATITDSAFCGNWSWDGSAVYNHNTGVMSVTGSTFSGHIGFDVGAIENDNTMTLAGCVFSQNTCDNAAGAVLNVGDATVTGCSFTGNTAGIGGAIYNFNAGTMSISNSSFATETDTIYNAGTMAFGGTIRTAANVTSTKAITVEPGAELVLDLSAYAGTTTKELLTDFDTMFGSSQSNLTISINVAENQKGTYILATGVSSLAQREFTVTIDGDTPESLVVEVGSTTQRGDVQYSLDLTDGTLSLSIVDGHPEEEQSVITVGVGTTHRDYLKKHVTGLKLLDVKTAGTFEGTILETQEGKANVKIANDGKVEISELKQHKDGSQTTIVMKKNATLVVSGTNGMSGIAKLTTADNCVVNATTGSFVGTQGNDSLVIGKSGTFYIDGILDLADGKNKIVAKASSVVYVNGEMFGVQSLTLANGAKDKGKTYLVTYGVAGTSNKDKIAIGKSAWLFGEYIDLADGDSSLSVGGAGSKLFVSHGLSGINSLKVGNGTAPTENGAAVVKIGGKLSLEGAKKNTLSIGKFGTATIGSVDINAKATVTIGANGTVTMRGDKLENISKLTVAAGAKYKDEEKNPQQGHTIFDAGSATIFGTTANDTLSFGNFSSVTLHDLGSVTLKSIDLGDGKDTLNIGGQGVVFDARDIDNISTFKVAAGKSAIAAEKADVDVWNITFDQVSNKLDIGAFADFTAWDISSTLDNPNVKTTVSIGSGGTASISSINQVSSLKLAAGKKPKTGDVEKTTLRVSGELKGTDGNDTYAFGNDVTATFGAIDMKGSNDKDKLTIGKGSEVMAGDVQGVEIVTLGDGSTFGLGSGDIQGKITGSAKDNTLVFESNGFAKEVDLGKGDDAIWFNLDGAQLAVGYHTAIGSCLNVEKYYINGKEVLAGGIAVDIGNELMAKLEQNGQEIGFTVSIK